MDAAQVEGLGGLLYTPRVRLNVRTGEKLVMHFAKADPCYNENYIRRFQKEMWRDGKGTGSISYYTLFDV